MKVIVEVEKGSALELSEPKVFLGVRAWDGSLGGMTMTPGVHDSDKILPELEKLVECLKTDTLAGLGKSEVRDLKRDMSKIFNMTVWERFQFLLTGSIPLLIKDPRLD